jgi:hypothetical protein
MHMLHTAVWMVAKASIAGNYAGSARHELACFDSAQTTTRRVPAMACRPYPHHSVLRDLDPQTPLLATNERKRVPDAPVSNMQSGELNIAVPASLEVSVVARCP